MVFQWNTGRLYQADGQRIKAIQLADGSVLFADLSRGIDGQIAPTRAKIDDLDSMRRHVMSHYDRNDYQGNELSWKFAMLL